MSIINIIALAMATGIVFLAIGVAVYKWKHNTRADLTQRNKSK